MVSRAVKKLGVKRCQLCHKSGTESNKLVRHHCDSNPRNNQASNFLVVHQTLCHDFADFVSEWYLHFQRAATPEMIIRAWRTVNWED